MTSSPVIDAWHHLVQHRDTAALQSCTSRWARCATA